jgi:hypothetical protein
LLNPSKLLTEQYKKCIRISFTYSIPVSLIGLQIDLTVARVIEKNVKIIDCIFSYFFFSFVVQEFDVMTRATIASERSSLQLEDIERLGS